MCVCGAHVGLSVKGPKLNMGSSSLVVGCFQLEMAVCSSELESSLVGLRSITYIDGLKKKKKKKP